MPTSIGKREDEQRLLFYHDGKYTFPAGSLEKALVTGSQHPASTQAMEITSFRSPSFKRR
jgi:hypothetical protein